MTWFFAFFVLSGLCSLVYQVTWLRVAMANFGVTTPLVSILLSVFMAGLALGSWGAGRLTHRFKAGSAKTFLRLYAATELTIGLSGLLVPWLLEWGRTALTASSTTVWGSTSYYLVSGAWITAALLPFCTAMGATFPLAMAGIRAAFPQKSSRSFSYLYVANVAGAMAGALGSAFVAIELLGFRRTMLAAVFLNAIVAALAIWLGNRLKSSPVLDSAPAAGDETGRLPRPAQGRWLLSLLFGTGLASLAMEVVWSRQFVPFLGPFVYTFAFILAIYLAATLIGSNIYRAWVRGGRRTGEGDSWRILAVMAGASALLPLLAADPRLHLPTGILPGALRVTAGMGPFCAILGFLTPMVLDRLSGGDPKRAGSAYAVNTLGCIVGPLLAGFVFLPALGERWSLVILAMPLLAFGLVPALPEAVPGSLDQAKSRSRILPWLAAALTLSLLLVVFTRDFETQFKNPLVKRDYTATVVAVGQGRNKRLLVNGIGMTTLTPVTKMMVHLPLAFLEKRPEKGLVLCLGMGTTLRSMHSWGIHSTAVELVPSVPPLLSFFHADGESLLQSPLVNIVVDDARRFLERTPETFDVIAIDPPPPVEAATSSLLYSREFYRAAARRLAPGGILQQWLPSGEPMVVSAVSKALAERFPYVRIFRSVEGWGMHFLASADPIPSRTAADLAARLPKEAAADLVEWGPKYTAEGQFRKVLEQEIPLTKVVGRDPDAPVLTDDRPVNEYYLLRRLFKRNILIRPH